MLTLFWRNSCSICRCQFGKVWAEARFKAPEPAAASEQPVTAQQAAAWEAEGAENEGVRNPYAHTEGDSLLEALFLWDGFAEVIERFEVERQCLFGVQDGLFVGLAPGVAALKCRKMGEVAVGIVLD
jgi:hypothetical protein